MMTAFCAFFCAALVPDQSSCTHVDRVVVVGDMTMMGMGVPTSQSTNQPTNQPTN